MYQISIHAKLFWLYPNLSKVEGPSRVESGPSQPVSDCLSVKYIPFYGVTL